MNAALVETPASESVVSLLELDQLEPSSTNPRKTFDTKADAELAESIRQHGIVQPLVVRPLGDGRFQIVAGERRFRAAKKAKLASVPALVRMMDDGEALAIQIIENLQRQDVGAVEEGEGFRQLLQQNPAHWTPEAIAGTVGKSVRYVYARMQLAKLPEKIKKDLQSGYISTSHADLLVTLQPAEAERAAGFLHTRTDRWGEDKEKRDSAPSVRELKKWIQENINLDLGKAPFDITDAKLLPAAGACAPCPKRAGSNPLLFGEVAKGDVCTDPACYNAKRLALVQINAEAIEAKHGIAPTMVSTLYKSQAQKRQAGVLYADDYTSQGYAGGQWGAIKKDSCKSARLALYVDGDKIGKTEWVCIARNNCKDHSRSIVSSTGARAGSDGSAAAELRRKQRIAREYNTRLLQAIATSVTKPTRADRELIAFAFFQKLGHYHETPLLAALGWDKKLGAWDGKPALRKHFAGMKDAELDNALLLFAIASDLADQVRSARLEQVAARHKVDAGKILAEVKAKFPTPAEKKKASKLVKVKDAKGRVTAQVAPAFVTKKEKTTAKRRAARAKGALKLVRKAKRAPKPKAKRFPWTEAKARTSTKAKARKH